MSENFENLENMNFLHAILDGDIEHLLKHFAKNTYSAKYAGEVGNKTLEKCIQLMKLDYSVALINNLSGELSSHYPAKIVVLEHEKTQNQNNGSGAPTIYESCCETDRLLAAVKEARVARCRTRFVVPAILFKGKYVCRSSTLSGGPEIYSRVGYSYLFPDATEKPPNVPEAEPEPTPDSTDAELNPPREWNYIEWALFDKVRGHDIKLLNKLHVGTIVDLMVENKKVKYGLYVSSSEKVDKVNRYHNFQIIGLPYPGCEFFKDFSGHNYDGKKMFFDWAQEFVDAPINVPDDHVSNQLNIDWKEYTKWDLINITQNYVKLILKYLQEGSSGILIHCISGWDRTPLFVSLIRISLWADGLIHQSLDAKQMLYLTLAYDWYLFGHQLTDRIAKGEEILLFCFYIVKYIRDDEYNISSLWARNKKQEQPPAEKNVVQDESNFPMMLDSDLRGSNVSINSVCSSISTMSQDQLPASMSMSDDSQNGNSPPMSQNSVGDPCSNSNTRSPQSKRTSPVTVPCAKRKERQDSNSSLGSWQLITNSGSMKSSQKSDTSESRVRSGRRDRLNALRKTFYRIYPQSVGMNHDRKFYRGLLGALGGIAGYMYNN